MARIDALASTSRSGPLRSRVLNSRLTARSSAIFVLTRDEATRNEARTLRRYSRRLHACLARLCEDCVRGLAARIDAKRGTLYGARKRECARSTCGTSPISPSPSDSNASRRPLLSSFFFSPAREAVPFLVSPSPLRPTSPSPLRFRNYPSPTVPLRIYNRGWRPRRRERRRKKWRRGRIASSRSSFVA